jgi:2-oxoisovalerate dehydrogenase E1 component
MSARTTTNTTTTTSAIIGRKFTSSSVWDPYQGSHGSKIRELPEYKAMTNLSTFLKEFGHDPRTSGIRAMPFGMQEASYQHELSREDYLLSLDAAMATFLLHVNARIASMVGKGFYTIGPCGEEALGSAGVVFQPQDSTALHYRHTAISLARQLHGEGSRTMDELLLGRARGYAVSREDPVTGGVHCSIGGAANEYLVTSTLSSQCPPAVGRALGYALAEDDSVEQKRQKSKEDKAISFVTIGDGSLHNHHFLSSLTLARHAKHLQVKCPVVFGISDNGISISYRTKQYVDTVFPAHVEDPLLPVFRANGQDMCSVYDNTKKACDYARKYQSPCVLLYRNLVRRFGHAATDRQDAYLDSEAIQAMADTCVLESTIRQGIEVFGFTSYMELSDRFEELQQKTEHAFEQAIQEPKVTLGDMMDRVSVPLTALPSRHCNSIDSAESNNNVEKPQVMRKHMTRVIEEALKEDPSTVYLGEDVRHGGYYLVTEGLAKKFPKRILDFPPDETTLLGAALGMSQLGMTPIVEIPYAKYLDCGVDMFYEIAIQHWLTNPQPASDDKKQQQQQQQKKKQNHGMIIRLQGFDRGLFGGNFHTHNSLSHIPPGVDVVCYSNGRDYVRGFRHALWQAKHGRIVMLVDCTHLLNLRHIHDKDRAWEFLYPSNDPTDMIDFDQVFRYSGADVASDDLYPKSKDHPARIAIVTYGNGVVTSLQARKGMVDCQIVKNESEVDVIDCPYLSDAPSGLEKILEGYKHVLFADICKEGSGNIFPNMITSLHQRKKLPDSWGFVGAPRT